MSTPPRLDGFSHVTLNVNELAESVQWYGDVLGFRLLFEYDTEGFGRRLMIHPSGIVVGLTKHNHPDHTRPFNERTVGLDHLSFAVGTRSELTAWVDHFDRLAVTHSGIHDVPERQFTLIAFRDPSNIQLELYLTPKG